MEKALHPDPMLSPDAVRALAAAEAPDASSPLDDR
jgi:hypothetical protein